MNVVRSYFTRINDELATAVAQIALTGVAA
jgi:hypothetical protein